MELRTIKKVSVGEQVYDQMKGQIISGDWAQGNKIPSENQLMDIFGVSRSTVRQAIQKLSAVGLLETRRGEGSYVKRVGLSNYLKGNVPAAALNEDEIREVFSFRVLFECGVAEMAAEMATREQIKALQENYAQMLQSIEKENLKKYIETDYAFHCLLGECTQNSLVRELYKTFRETFVYTMTEVTEVVGYSHGKEFHNRILKAIEKHNPEEAREAMKQHTKNHPIFSEDYEIKMKLG